MGTRTAILLLALCTLAPMVAGCSFGDSGDSSAEKAAAADRSRKQREVSKARSALRKDPEDADACRRLAAAYLALASPVPQAGKNVSMTMPKDRDESLSDAIDTLRDCLKADDGDQDARQMLASALMETGGYGEAARLYRALARSSTGAQRADAYYGLGVASSNLRDFTGAIAAYERFVATAPKSDSRVISVRLSIASLRQAMKQPTQQATTTTGNR